MKAHRQVIMRTVLAMGLGLAMGAGARASDGPIKIAIHEWTGQHISAHIAGEVLARAGYRIEYVVAGAIPSFAAIAQGNLHLQPEVWDNQVADIFPKAVAAGDIVIVGRLGLTPREGWIYPAYMEQECPGLPAPSALIACAGLFATSETFPKGRLVAYPADWGTRSRELVATAGLPFQAVAGGSEGAMIAELKAAYDAAQPILMMFWAPHWVHAQMAFKWVDLPAPEPGCATDPKLGLNPDVTGDCGFARPRILKIVWKGFKGKWPGAFKIVEQITIDNRAQNRLLLEVDQKKRNLEDVIADWMAANETTWKGWIEAR